MKVYISKHPSRGFLLNIPLAMDTPEQIQADRIINNLMPFAVWKNSPSVKNHIELEFCTETGETIDGFRQWVKWTVGVLVHELEIERI